MQTRPLPETPDARSPAGAEIRYLMEGATGNMIHSTVPPGQVNRATVHATVSEFWHVLSGRGEIWRRDESGEEVTVLTPGVSIDIPVGTAFQYRCTGAEPLRFLCITMPPWPGNAEATHIEVRGCRQRQSARCRRRRASSATTYQRADNADLVLSQAPQPTSSCVSSFRQIV
jgi:mannose-6-phosphate isomerase-like protein (cupin superfamily)